MRKKKIHDKPEMLAFRRHLRNNATPAEAFLWKHLQRSQLEGRKFRRQHSIHNYIVDFYCASKGLIVELDGQVHMDPAAEERDRQREAVLERMGFIVLRFENKMVFDFLPSVLKDIFETILGKTGNKFTTSSVTHPVCTHPNRQGGHPFRRGGLGNTSF